MSITLNPSPSTFPLTEMIESGLWAALSPAARAVLGVIWDFHRKFPDACHPSRATLSELSGVSEPTVSRTIDELSRAGYIEVIARPPLVNTYRLRWSDLPVPEKAQRKKRSPYKRPNPESSTALLTNGNGRDRAVIERKHYHHKMADGCIVRSAHETVIHSYLVDWRVPHWSNVSYRSLGVMGLHHEATVDFVVGPKLLIEVFGLPRFQSQVTKYNVNRKKKEDAIKAAGWTLIALEPSDRELREEHLNIILDRWAESSDEQAVALYHTIKDAGCWRDGSPSTLRLLELVNDARARYKGDVEPASPRGLYEPDPDDHNPLSDAMRRCKPRIVLAQHYGRDAVGTPAEKSLQHLGGESVQPTVPAPAQPETPSLNSVTSSNSPAARSSTPHVEPDAQSYKEDMKRPDALAYEDDDDDEHDDDGFDAFLPDTL